MICTDGLRTLWLFKSTVFSLSTYGKMYARQDHIDLRWAIQDLGFQAIVSRSHWNSLTIADESNGAKERTTFLLKWNCSGISSRLYHWITSAGIRRKLARIASVCAGLLGMRDGFGVLSTICERTRAHTYARVVNAYTGIKNSTQLSINEGTMFDITRKFRVINSVGKQVHKYSRHARIISFGLRSRKGCMKHTFVYFHQTLSVIWSRHFCTEQFRDSSPRVSY